VGGGRTSSANLLTIGWWTHRTSTAGERRPAAGRLVRVQVVSGSVSGRSAARGDQPPQRRHPRRSPPAAPTTRGSGRQQRSPSAAE